MIKFKHWEDIFKSQAFALINAVNCEGFMWKWIAFQFKSKFPKNTKAYIDTCKYWNLKIGSLFLFEENWKLIINFPTKNKWREKSTYKAIDLWMIQLISEIKAHKIKSIAIPALWCWNGWLEWEKVKSILLWALSEIEDIVDIEIFEPYSDNINYKNNDIEKFSKLTLSHLLLMGIKLRLNKFNKIRLQKTAFIYNTIIWEEYFKFSKNHFGPYAHSIEILSDGIKKFQEHYKIQTNEAYERIRLTLISFDVERKIKRIEFATEFVNSIKQDKQLELITTILFLIKQKSVLTEEEIIHEVKSWSLEKAKKYSEKQIIECSKDIIKAWLVERSLFWLVISNKTDL